MFELLFTGLYLGAIHIFSAPDHLAAIVPLSLLDRKKSWRIGLIWAVGHLIGLLVLGVLLYYFKSLINIEFLEHYGMLYIALLLVFIGLWIVFKSTKINFSNLQKHQKHLTRISLGTGIIHGFAAVSHIYSLAPTISMDDIEFFSYFGGFAFGSLFSVVAFTYFLGIIPNRIASSERFYQKLLFWSGSITIIVGVLFILLFFLGVHTH